MLTRTLMMLDENHHTTTPSEEWADGMWFISTNINNDHITKVVSKHSCIPLLRNSGRVESVPIERLYYDGLHYKMVNEGGDRLEIVPPWKQGKVWAEWR